MRTVSSSPHIHTALRTDRAMQMVTLALLPASFWGIYCFGWRALLVLVLSVASTVLTEYLLTFIDKSENTIPDGSAIVTGLLIGMNMPPRVPVFIPILAGIFAIFVVKWTFGGLGANWMNPALAGRVFVFFSFTSQMSAFTSPWFLASDTVSGATALSSIKTLISGGNLGAGYGQMLTEFGMPTTGIASSIASATGISPYTVDAFLGNTAGCIGEVSSLLLLIGGIYLIARHVITWHIPVVFIGSFAVLSWVFGGIPRGTGMFSGEILLPVFSGGMMLGAFFMATDWVTSPTTIKGQCIYAFGCGFFTFLIRYFGSLPEGVSLAILLMNIVTPTIDRYIGTKKFGYVKPEKKKKEEKA